MTRKRSVLRDRSKRKTQRGGTKRGLEPDTPEPDEPEPDEPEQYPIDPNILSVVRDGWRRDTQVKDLIASLSKWTPDRDPCFHTTTHSLTILKKGMIHLETNFEK